MATLFVRLPNHVGDAVMTMPALNLLEAAGFKLYLIGKPFVGELFEGTNRRFDPIEGNLLDDIKRIRDLAASVKNSRGILMPNSFGSALLFKSAGIQSTGLATDGRSILLEHAIPEPPRMHEVERFWYVAYEALKAMGIKPPYTKLTKRINMKLAARLPMKPKRLKLLVRTQPSMSRQVSATSPHFAKKQLLSSQTTPA